MPWQQETSSPLVALAQGLAQYAVSKQQRKQQELENQYKQAQTKALQAQTLQGTLLPFPGSQGTTATTPSSGPTVPPVASNAPTVAKGPFMDGPPPAQPKTLGTVAVHAKAPGPPTPSLQDQINYYTQYAQYGAQHNSPATAEYAQKQLSILYPALAKAREDATTYMRDMNTALYHAAEANHWSAQEIETHRHNIATEAGNIYHYGIEAANNMRTTAQQNTDNLRTTTTSRENAQGVQAVDMLKLMLQGPGGSSGTTKPSSYQTRLEKFMKMNADQQKEAINSGYFTPDELKQVLAGAGQ